LPPFPEPVAELGGAHDKVRLDNWLDALAELARGFDA
jgi:hypothetical protein